MSIAALDMAVLPEAAEALRPGIRALVARETASMTLPERSRSWMGYSAAFSSTLASSGYLGLTLPVEYGGRGLGPFARFVVVLERAA